ncbi:hypothetical protein Q5X28_16785 [Acinetobacter baumannii]|nr:hypothetical protein [Acinetobacter baumannii]
MSSLIKSSVLSTFPKSDYNIKNNSTISVTTSSVKNVSSNHFYTRIINTFNRSVNPKEIGGSINEVVGFESKTNIDPNKIYELELKEKFEKKFINSLNNKFIDEEEILYQAYELKLHLMINNPVTCAWLVDVHNKSLSNKTIIENLFKVLSTLDEFLLTSTIVLMLGFSLHGKSVKVKNSALELLESLILQNRKDAYLILKEIETEIKPTWLETYKKTILEKNIYLLG